MSLPSSRVRKSIVASTLLAVLALSFITTFSTLSIQRSSAQSPVTITGISDWKPTTNYGAASASGAGVALTLQSCVPWSGYVYCVGGFGASTPSSLTSAVYYAQLNPAGGVGAWTETTDYGAPSGSSGTGGVLINRESCVANNGYIYCVGGQSYSGGAYVNFLSKVFYAPLSSNGVGAWTETTDYGASSGTSGSGGLQAWPRCVVYSSYIYCIGGKISSGDASADYYASLTSSGVSAWTETTDYGATSGSSTGTAGVKIEGHSCTIDANYVYCVGGTINSGGSTSFYSSIVYYAQLSASGIGSWTETTDYGSSSGSTTGSAGLKLFGTACADYTGYVFCVGGRNSTGAIATVYFASVSPSGAGSWTRTKNLGDQEVDNYNENDFVWASDCAVYLQEILGGTAGDWFAFLIGLSDTCPGPHISTTLSATSINATQSVYDTAQLSGVTSDAGGTVKYIYYAGSNCSGPSATFTVSVTNGQVPKSPTVTENLAGPESWQAVYSGDANNPPATSACEPMNVGKANPTISTQTKDAFENNINTTGVGDATYDSATLHGATPQAGGTVTYYAYSGGACGGTSTQLGVPVTVINGLIIPSRPISFNQTGSYSFQATYSGDNSNNGAKSACEPLGVVESVGHSSSTNTSLPLIRPILFTVLNPSATIQTGGSVYDSAGFVSGSLKVPAGGTVTYYYYAFSTCSTAQTKLGQVNVSSNGDVPNSPSETLNVAGSYSFMAVYSGDANNPPTSSACEKLNVTGISLHLYSTLSNYTIISGNSFTIYSTLNGFAGNPSGNMSYDFYKGGNCSGSIFRAYNVADFILQGNRTSYVVPGNTFSTPGPYSLWTDYGGYQNYAPVVSSCVPFTISQSSSPTPTKSSGGLLTYLIAVLAVVAILGGLGFFFYRGRGSSGPPSGPPPPVSSPAPTPASASSVTTANPCDELMKNYESAYNQYNDFRNNLNLEGHNIETGPDGKVKVTPEVPQLTAAEAKMNEAEKVLDECWKTSGRPQSELNDFYEKVEYMPMTSPQTPASPSLPSAQPPPPSDSSN